MRRLLLALGLLASACASASVAEVGGGAARPLSLTPASETPPVDATRISVDPDEIIFDTFGRGPQFTLANGSADQIADLLDAIAPIDAPSYGSADQQDWLSDEDLVVGYVDATGSAWAYPVRMLNQHEIVNDMLGGRKVVITYCPLCGSGVVYDRTVNDTELTFSNTSALYENDMVMVDRETGSYWWQVAGSAIVGELNGSVLTPLPAQTTTWSSWLAQYPETAVMERIAGRSYDSDSFASYPERLDRGRTPFPVSAEALDDDRLSPATRVVAVTINGETVAWPTEPARTEEAVVGGEAVTVILDGTGGVVRNEQGDALGSRTAFWFSIRSAYPDVVVGGADCADTGALWC